MLKVTSVDGAGAVTGVKLIDGGVFTDSVPEEGLTVSTSPHIEVVSGSTLAGNARRWLP